MNLRVLHLILSVGSFGAIVPPVAAQDPSVPEQVKQWMQQCTERTEQAEYAEYAKRLPACQQAVAALLPCRCDGGPGLWRHADSDRAVRPTGAGWRRPASSFGRSTMPYRPLRGPPRAYIRRRRT